MTDGRALKGATEAYLEPSHVTSARQFASTFALFAAVTAAAYAALSVSVWLTLALALPAAGLTVRLFIIQHDCGHGSFFRSRRANDLLGRFCSAFTFTPYAFWRRQHANHHASFNNLDRRDSGLDLYSTCLTLREYEVLTPPRRFLYCLSRHPVVTQLVLPPLIFLLLYRVPFDTPRSWRGERASVHLTNLGLAGVLGAQVLLLGFWPVVLVQLAIMLPASIIGVWTFSVQHRFEDALWARQADWSLSRAALEGSSYLRLPRILQWFTGNIGFHHVHHLAVRVPNYRLQACHEASPALSAGVTTLTIRDALRAPTFALWDEDRGRMVPFPRPSRRGAEPGSPSPAT